MNIRNRLSDAGIAVKSRRITDLLLSRLDPVKKASVVMGYLSFGSEVRTDSFLQEMFKSGKEIVVPAVYPDTKKIKAYPINNLDKDLTRGHYGIREPVNRRYPAGLGKIDLVLVPGVAFDLSGNRIGYGAGYYDRFLAGADPGLSKVSVCFECQLRESIPVDDHDIGVDFIVTEDRLIKCDAC